MPFAVGDKVVHPYHGPGLVSGVERREFMDGPMRYYVLDIPGHGLTVHIPVSRADDMGMRRAIPRSRLARVLGALRSKPNDLPQDYKERQEQICAEIKSGKVMRLAAAVRDLTWHRERAHLTRRDSDLLKQGQELLAAEMALVSGDDVDQANALIEATLEAAVATRVVEASG